MPYFLETDEVIHGREARELYLEELERDTLQYRLMHKGYERFYPSYGGIHTLHADKIDGDSVFGTPVIATRQYSYLRVVFFYQKFPNEKGRTTKKLSGPL